MSGDELTKPSPPDACMMFEVSPFLGGRKHGGSLSDGGALCEDWRLDGERWRVVALPQVLSVLDERKRDPNTRDAALKVSRQIEELDRPAWHVHRRAPRKLSYRDIAVTADMGSTLPWLRAAVTDGVIIAGSLELAWQDLHRTRCDDRQRPTRSQQGASRLG